jgi:hypothetical protein
MDPGSKGPNDHKRGLESNQCEQMVSLQALQSPYYFPRCG